MADKSRADAREVVDRCRSESAADHPKLRWDRHFGSESLLACEVEYRQVVQREAQCWELVVKLFAEISSSTSAATFANRELPNWVDGEKERVAVKLNLQSSANLSPFDNRSSRCQLCLSTELYLHVLKVFFYRERSTFTAPGPCSPPESPEVASANHRRPWRCLWQEAFGGWKCPKVTGGDLGRDRHHQQFPDSWIFSQAKFQPPAASRIPTMLRVHVLPVLQ